MEAILFALNKVREKFSPSIDISEALKTSNDHYWGPPLNYCPIKGQLPNPHANKRKRWGTLPVPVTGDIDHPAVGKAIEKINRKTGRALLIVARDHTDEDGITIKFDCPYGNHVGTVAGSLEPGELYTARYPLRNQWEIHGRHYIRLAAESDPRLRGQKGVQIIMHEFAHALGLFEHIEGAFSDTGKSVRDPLFAVLRELYKDDGTQSG